MSRRGTLAIVGVIAAAAAATCTYAVRRRRRSARAGIEASQADIVALDDVRPPEAEPAKATATA